MSYSDSESYNLSSESEITQEFQETGKNFEPVMEDDYSDDDLEFVPQPLRKQPADGSSSDEEPSDDTMDEVPKSVNKKKQVQESDTESSDSDMEEIPESVVKAAQEKRKAASAAKQKQAALPKPKTEIIYKAIDEMKDDIKVPSKDEFINSPAIKCLTWMLANIHKKSATPVGKKAKEPAKQFGEKLSKQEMEELYKLFSSAYPIKATLRKLMNEKHSEPKFSTSSVEAHGAAKVYVIKTKIVQTKTSKQQTIYHCSPEEMLAIQKFDKYIHDMSTSINKSLITADNLREFLSLDIWNTKYVCDYKDTIKPALLDFSDFGFSYIEDFDYEIPIIENRVEDYIGLFNKKTIKDSYEIFKHRFGIISGNEDIFTDKKIDDMFKSTISNLSKNGTEIEKILRTLLKMKPIKDIFIRGVNANKFIDRCLSIIFKHADFKKIIFDKLYSICFLFSPYMFKNPKMEEDHGKGEKKSIISKAKSMSSRREKIIKDFILNIQDNCNKNENYWIGFLGVDKKDNYWYVQEEQQPIKKTEEEHSEEEPLMVKSSKSSAKSSAKSSSASRKSDAKKAKNSK